MRPAELLDQMERQGIRSLALIGSSKNAGKTTVLKHLIRTASGKDHFPPLALTSIGVDGEGEDVVTGGVKPRIWLPESCWIATARESLRRSDALLEIRAMTGIESNYGEIVLAQAVSPGFVELAGPSMAQELRHCERLLRELEPDCLFLVDGALSRRSPAGGGLSEAAILAVSCFSLAEPEKLVQESIHATRLLTLPLADPSSLEILRQRLEKEPKLRALKEIEPGIWQGWEAETLLGEEESSSAFMGGDELSLCLRGALTSSLFRRLLREKGKKLRRLIVEDGTRLFISERDWMEGQRQGLKIEFLHPLKVLMLAVNPCRRDGSQAESDALVDELSKALAPLPVVDWGPALED